MEINWGILGQTGAAILVALTGLWVVLRARHAAEVQEQRERIDTATAREKANDETELGYIDRLQLRIKDLELDNDRLRREREDRSDRNNVQLRHELATLRDLVQRAQAPLEESNALTEEALKLMVSE